MADGIDTTQLRKLTRDFKAWKPDKQLHKALRVAGGLIVDDAKLMASEHSKSIPPTIKLRVTKTRLTVRAGDAETPIAGLYEEGNKGRSKPDSFRHPVFNSDVWVEQPRHPFLWRSVVKNARNIERLEGVAVAEAFRERDFEVS